MEAGCIELSGNQGYQQYDRGRSTKNGGKPKGLDAESNSSRARIGTKHPFAGALASLVWPMPASRGRGVQC